MAFVIVGAGAAEAHPGLRPDEIEAGQATRIDLVMEHDCDPDGGVDAPTTLVAIRVPDAIAAAEPLEVAGWRTSTETDESDRTTVVQWTAEPDAAPATPPTLPVRLTAHTADQSTTLDLVVLQECSRGSYLWGGGDDREPPVTLRIQPGVLKPDGSDVPSPAASTIAPAESPTLPVATPTPARPTPLASPSPVVDGPTTPPSTGTALGPVLWSVVVLVLVGAAGLLLSRR